MSHQLLTALEHQVLSIFDQNGCPGDWSELAAFIRGTPAIGLREIGRQTYLITDSGFDPQTFGLNRSFVVMLKLDSRFTLSTLTPQYSSAAAA